MSAQGRYWILTIPFASWSVPETLPDKIKYLKGQQEIGESGYHHWQLLCCSEKMRLNALKALFCTQAHIELTRSEAADQYVWKEDTRVEGSQFELGTVTSHTKVNDPSSVTLKPTGHESCLLPKKISLKKSKKPRRMLSSETTILLRGLQSTTLGRLQDPTFLSRVTGARQELERHVAYLKRLETTTISKTPIQSGGMDTEARRISSLMNSPVKSKFPTSSSGLIDTPVKSKSKVANKSSLGLVSGSPPTSPLMIGSPQLLLNKFEHLSEE